MMSNTLTSTPLATITKKARRTGRTKLMSQQRPMTFYYNPALAGHCGFQCMLRAARKNTRIGAVMVLRAKVTRELERVRLQDEHIAGIRVHDLITQEGFSLQVYLCALERDIWASKVKLHIAATLFGISV